MKRKVVSVLFGSLVALAALLWVGSPAPAWQLRMGALMSGIPTRHDPVLRHLGVSRPLREAVHSYSLEAGLQERRILPVRRVPQVLSLGMDPVVQRSGGKTLSTSPGLNFGGLMAGDN